ncbi:MAG: hypothetical protein BYD32DRAFT_173849 [Podila humilis]|nr:MAG: hypothetical protein BYD32DRAFT_173849 [Podila humilis]
MGWGYRIKPHNTVGHVKPDQADRIIVAGKCLSNSISFNRHRQRHLILFLYFILDTHIPDCAFIRFGHESCTRRHCHVALISLDSTSSLVELNKPPSRPFSKITLKEMWRRVKSLKPKARLWTLSRSRVEKVHEPLPHPPVETSLADSSLTAKRALLQARRTTPSLSPPQPLSSRVNLQSDHGSFTSVSYRAANSSAASWPTWTSSNQDYFHEQRVSCSSIESGPRRPRLLPPRLLLDHPLYYQPVYWSQSFSPHQSITESELMAHLSLTPPSANSRYYSLHPPQSPVDPYRHKMQQRRILSSVLRDLP